MAKPDLTAGMQAKSAVYDHVGNDFDTGKPIMKRKADAKPMVQQPAAAAQPMQHKPAMERPAEAQPKPAEQQEEEKPAAKPQMQPRVQQAKPALQPAMSKGSAVRMADGTTGKVAFSDGVNARVKTDAGKNVSVKHHQITPMQEVKVRAHTRMVAKREDGDANGTAKTNGDSDMAPGDGPNPERQFTRASISRDAK